MTVSEKTELTRECNGTVSDPEDPEESEDPDSEQRRCSKRSFKEGGNEDDVKRVNRRFFKEETLQKFKSVASHVGLLLTLMVYTAVGGVVSYILLEV